MSEVAEGYICRLPISPRLGPYGTHKQVYKALPNRPVYRRFKDHAIVVSKEAPQESVDSKPFCPKIVAGENLRFALKADISKSKFISGKRGERYDPVLDARKEDPKLSYGDIAEGIGHEWIARKGTECGFRLIQADCFDYEQIRFIRPDSQRQIRFSAIDFQGILEVIDTNSFCKALLGGIGRGKAFGLGLLLVRRS